MRIEALKQTAASFAAYQLATLIIGTLEEFPSFHAILTSINAVDDPSLKKQAFLEALNNAIKENNQINVVISFSTRLLLPFVYWFSELFSNNLTNGIKRYLRETVIPSIKKDHNKRLHSSPINAVGRSFDDFNKMMRDFAEHPNNSAWEVREHIKFIKDRKVYNGERSANEIYNEFAVICVEELMPKFSWKQDVHHVDETLNAWANSSTLPGMSIFKQILLIPVRIPLWIFEYGIVLPFQSMMQSLVNWGTKKCFVETQLVQGIMETIKTTNFKETPYVPILDVLAKALTDIHEAQKRGDPVDRSNYQSDDANKQMIKACIDRMLVFIELWETNSRDEIKAILEPQQGMVNSIKNSAKTIILPHMQTALVEVLEIVQSLATEETQLETFLFQICDIAETALSQTGKPVSEADKLRKEMEYQNLKKLIESTLNAILWKITIQATNTLGEPGVTKAAEEHVQWLKNVFLDSHQTPSQNDLVDDPEDGTFSSVVPSAEKKGLISSWKETFGNLDQQGLNAAYQSCSDLIKELERKEVALQINPGSYTPKIGAVTAEHLKQRSSAIYDKLALVCEQFHHLYRIYTYNSYDAQENNPIEKIVYGCSLRDIESLTSWIKEIRANDEYKTWPLALNKAIEQIEQLAEAMRNNEKKKIALCIAAVETSKAAIESEFKEAKALLIRNDGNITPIHLEIGAMMNHLNELEHVVENTTHVEFLEISNPSFMKAGWKSGMSILRQTLFKEMSSRSNTLIHAMCNPEVIEMLLRNLAIRPLVESFRGENIPSYARDDL
jgi:hypothetical protein